MRAALRALGVLVALVAVVAGALTWAVPAWLERAHTRTRITAAVRDATGLVLEFEGLAAGWLPPRLRIRGLVLRAPEDVHGRLLEADAATLRLDARELLAGRAVVVSVALEGPALHLVLGGSAPARVGGPSPAPSVRAPNEADASAALALPLSPRTLGVRTVELHHGRVELEDGRLDPALRLGLEDLEGRADDDGRGTGSTFVLTGRLASGGTAEVHGTLVATGTLDVEVTLAAVDLAPVAGLLGPGRSLLGRFDGVIRCAGPVGAPRTARLDGQVSEAQLDLGPITLTGSLVAEADLLGLFVSPRRLGFSLDATEAEVRYAGGFRKPPGTSATAVGRVEIRPDGKLEVEDLHVRVKDLATSGVLPRGVRFGGEPVASPLEGAAAPEAAR